EVRVLGAVPERLRIAVEMDEQVGDGARALDVGVGDEELPGGVAEGDLLAGGGGKLGGGGRGRCASEREDDDRGGEEVQAGEHGGEVPSGRPFYPTRNLPPGGQSARHL